MKIRSAAVALAVTAGVALGAAAPAAALSIPSPSGCYTRELQKTWKIDNPNQAGTQKWGYLYVYAGWCTSSGTEFRGVWSEARRDDSGSIKVGIGTHQNFAPYATYSASKWHSGFIANENPSPVIEKESSFWGWAEAYKANGGPLVSLVLYSG